MKIYTTSLYVTVKTLRSFSNGIMPLLEICCFALWNSGVQPYTSEPLKQTACNPIIPRKLKFL